jgi:hypothetical protein
VVRCATKGSDSWSLWAEPKTVGALVADVRLADRQGLQVAVCGADGAEVVR